MSKLFWLSQEQLNLISPYFPASRGVPRVDDRRVISGIIYVIKNGLRWCMPRETMVHTKHCTIVLNVGAPLAYLIRIFTELSHQSEDKPDYVAIDATYLESTPDGIQSA